MKIRHVLRGRCNPRNADGIIRHTYGVAQAQRRLGHDVAVIGLGAQVENAEVIMRDGLPVHAFPRQRNPLRTPEEVRAHVASERADVYHIQVPFDPAGASFGWMCEHLGLPYVLSPHSLWSPHALRRKRLKKSVYALLIERRLARRALAVHATARAELDDIRSFVPSARAFVVRSGVDLDRIDAHRRDTTIWAEQFGDYGRVYAFLGRLDPDQKGLDMLLEGWARFRSSGDETGARLALIGPDWRSSRAELTARAEALDIADSVAFTGALFGHDKYAALASADAYVQTSRYEGTPYSVQEALACRLPAIVTPGTNFAASVAEYDAGVDVALDPDDIARGFRQIDGSDDARIERMRANARRLVEDRHSMARAAGRFVTAYRALLAGGAYDDDD